MDCYDATIGFADATEGQVATRGRLVAWLLILDILLAWCCRTELRYGNAIELPAQFCIIGKVDHCNRHGCDELYSLRYTFRDPQTGLRRQNTVQIPPSLVPAGQQVMIQYLPGEYPQSRLVVQGKPTMVTIFFSINAVFALIGVGGLIWLSRQANTSLPRGVRSMTPAQRRIEIA